MKDSRTFAEEARDLHHALQQAWFAILDAAEPVLRPVVDWLARMLAKATR